jgi:SEC-C motif-containing protein
MRSRYSAFALRDAVYLTRTWHTLTRPSRLDLGTGRTWTRLEVLATSGGSLFDLEGQVRFRAHYLEHGASGVQEENSRFVRESGHWMYVGGMGGSVRP